MQFLNLKNAISFSVMLRPNIATETYRFEQINLNIIKSVNECRIFMFLDFCCIFNIINRFNAHCRPRSLLASSISEYWQLQYLMVSLSPLLLQLTQSGREGRVAWQPGVQAVGCTGLGVADVTATQQSLKTQQGSHQNRNG